MQNNTRRRLVLIGLENSLGELDGQLAALPVQNGFSMSPEGDSKARDIVLPSMSNIGSKIGAKNWKISAPFELMGGGLEADEVKNPPIHPLLLASGMVQEAGILLAVSDVTSGFKLGAELRNNTTDDVVGTVMQFVPGADSTTGVLWLRDVKNLPAVDDELSADTATAKAGDFEKALVYRYESDRANHKKAILHAHYDGQRRIATGIAGSMQFDWKAGEICTVQFELSGLYETPSNQPIPSAQFDLEREPPIGESAGLRMGAYPTALGTIEGISLNTQADIQPIADINSPHGRKTYRIAGRNPTGTINPEVVSLSAFNPWQLWEQGDKAAITATLGTVAGERISIAIPAPRVTGLADEERAGSDAQQISFEATGTNDDELYLIFH